MEIRDDKPITVHSGDAFVAYLRTLPDEEAVALVKHAVTRGLDKKHNQRVLFYSKAFVDWLLDRAALGYTTCLDCGDMDAKGMFGTPTTIEQVRAELDARDEE